MSDILFSQPRRVAFQFASALLPIRHQFVQKGIKPSAMVMMQEVEQFMQRNFATGITQEDLARELCVSRRQISRIMPRLYEGATFQKKLDEIRMYHALQHLLLTDTPVEDIAPLVGYTSTSGFFVAFKRTFGISPAAYRRAYRKAPPTT